MRLSPTVVALIVSALAPIAASERVFTYTYDSNVLAEGERELELWTTYRHGRSYYFRRIDERIEFEFGVTNRLQTAFYFNFKSQAEAQHDAQGNENAFDPVTGKPILDHESGVEGVSWEWKYKLSDPVADAFGSAAYVELSANAEEYELELKAIVDKVIDNTLIALNLTAEPEWKFSPGFGHPEYQLFANLGISQRLAERFRAGIEVQSASVFAHNGSGYELEYSTVAAGPVVHYKGAGFWATLTAMPQLYAFKNQNENQDHLELQSQERFQTRLLIGMHF